MRPTVENRPTEFSMFRYHNMFFPDHLHAQIELMLPQKGVLLARVSGREYEVTAGEALLVFPDQLHGYAQSEYTEGLTFIFSPSLLPGLGFDWNAMRPLSPVVSLRTDDQRYAASRLMEICASPKSDDPMMQALLHLLLAGLTQSLRLETIPFAPVGDLLYQALAYISRHAAGPLTAKSVARAIGVNEYYLSHLMSDKLHMGFRTYLNTLRIDRAKRLLCNSLKPIEEVGLACGFQTLRTFDRVFKQLCGCSPSAYRKSYLESRMK